MRSVMDMLRAREVSAAPVTVDGVTVTPRSRALVVRLPKGGLVWHRPDRRQDQMWKLVL
jgi:hypothetical protein